MKLTFAEIKQRLEDPFFELRMIGKDTVRMRTAATRGYVEVPDNLQFMEWSAEGSSETILYSFHETSIGRLLLAGTTAGLCFLGFACHGDAEVEADFVRRFPGQPVERGVNRHQELAAGYCNGNREQVVALHLKGTDFQVGIWKRLVCIPEGGLSTYGSLSDDPGAAQAVGSAVGANPVSYIVPCHRVVKSDGDIRGYHWGTDIKKQLLAYELQP